MQPRLLGSSCKNAVSSSPLWLRYLLVVDFLLAVGRNMFLLRTVGSGDCCRLEVRLRGRKLGKKNAAFKSLFVMMKPESDMQHTGEPGRDFLKWIADEKSPGSRRWNKEDSDL